MGSFSYTSWYLCPSHPRKMLTVLIRTYLSCAFITRKTLLWGSISYIPLDSRIIFNFPGKVYSWRPYPLFSFDGEVCSLCKERFTIESCLIFPPGGEVYSSARSHTTPFSSRLKKGLSETLRCVCVCVQEGGAKLQPGGWAAAGQAAPAAAGGEEEADQGREQAHPRSQHGVPG